MANEPTWNEVLLAMVGQVFQGVSEADMDVENRMIIAAVTDRGFAEWVDADGGHIRLQLTELGAAISTCDLAVEAHPNASPAFITIRQIFDAAPMLHWRQCHDCGNAALHIENAGHWVKCRKCESRDTRQLTKETDILKAAARDPNAEALQALDTMRESAKRHGINA